ncbi:MAG: hypothetical protein R3240_08420, partial [Gammaproteobacteria bacterium]|nr:hypothetical protein [Gammaproteobacteria bacterium]
MELNATPSLWLQSGFVGLALILAGWWIWLFKRATYLSHLKQKTDSQAATRKSHKAFYITSVFLFL